MKLTALLLAIAATATLFSVSMASTSAQAPAPKKINIQNLLDQGYEMKGVYLRNGDPILYFQKGPSLRVCSESKGGCDSLSLK